jgi:hypothetical protein
MNIPTNGRLVRPVIDNLNIDAEPGEVRRQHQARGTSANYTHLASGGRLWQAPEKREGIGGILFVDGHFLVGRSGLLRFFLHVARTVVPRV